MSSWKLTSLAAALGLACASTALAADPDKTAYKAAKDRISTEYKAAKENCKTMDGDAKKSCLKDAKAQRDQELSMAKQESGMTSPGTQAPATAPARAGESTPIPDQLPPEANPPPRPAK